MTPTARKWFIGGVLATALSQCLLSHVAPVILLSAGWASSIPAWLELFLSNLLGLLISVLLIDIAWTLPRQHRPVQATLFFTAVAAPCLALLLKSAASPYIIVLSGLAVLAVGCLSLHRELPLRVYHALSWYAVTWFLGFLGALYGSMLSPLWSNWLTIGIESGASFTALAFFAAWCTPLSKVPLKAALIAGVTSVVFAFFVAIAGHFATGSVLAATGLTLSLPLFVYTLDAFLVMTTVLTLLSSNGEFLRGLTIFLLLLSGFSFSNSNFALLSVLLLTLLVISYPARSHGLWHDWRQVLAQKWSPEEAAGTG